APIGKKQGRTPPHRRNRHPPPRSGRARSPRKIRPAPAANRTGPVAWPRPRAAAKPRLVLVDPVGPVAPPGLLARLADPVIIVGLSWIDDWGKIGTIRGREGRGFARDHAPVVATLVAVHGRSVSPQWREWSVERHRRVAIDAQGRVTAAR